MRGGLATWKASSCRRSSVVSGDLPPKCGSASCGERSRRSRLRQQRVHVALSRAVERIDHHLEARLADHLQVHQAPHALQVRVAGIDPLDQTPRLGIARRDLLDPRTEEQGVGPLLDLPAALGSAGPPQPAENFMPLYSADRLPP